MRKLDRPRGRGFLVRVRRFKWVLTILGALMVFSTFVIKDLKRDELKSFMDSLSATETSYQIRRDIAALSDSSNKSFSEETTRDSLDAANVRIGDWLQQIGSTLDNLADLIDAEGDKATTEQKHMLSALKSRRQIEFKRFEGREDWISNLPEAPSADQPKSTLSTPSAATIMQTIDDSILHNAQLSRDVAFVSDEVFTHAREIEKEQQGAYRRFTRISTYLYSAGWLIGLMGQFLGVEPVAE